MANKIFISYRRDDVASFAGRVFDRLEREFGRDALFMDVDAIALGVDFVKVIDEEVAKCDVLLAIIGPGWLGAPDEDGDRRLDNQDDFVRIEIAAALKRDIPVIPIRVDGTLVPKARQLPDEIKGLASRNGLDVRHASFHNDMERLIRELGRGKPLQQTAPIAPVVSRMNDAENQRRQREAEAARVLNPTIPAPNENETIRRYRANAAKGDANALVQLGLYQNGSGGLPMDEREAARLYKLAGDQGNAGGQGTLND